MEPSGSPEEELAELSVVGVRVELPSQQPIVLLKEVEGDRYLPIWIGAVEATAIAFAQQGVVTARPMTHDLLRDLLDALRPAAADRHDHRAAGGRLLRRARLRAAGSSSAPGPPTRSRWRMRTGARSAAHEAVLDEAGIAIPDEQEDEVEKFREFLDTITPGGLREGVLTSISTRGRGSRRAGPTSLT